MLLRQYCQKVLEAEDGQRSALRWAHPKKRCQVRSVFPLGSLNLAVVSNPVKPTSTCLLSSRHAWMSSMLLPAMQRGGSIVLDDSEAPWEIVAHLCFTLLDFMLTNLGVKESSRTLPCPPTISYICPRRQVPQLLYVRCEDADVHAVEMPLSCASLTIKDCCRLDLGKGVYTWGWPALVRVRDEGRARESVAWRSVW